MTHELPGLASPCRPTVLFVDDDPGIIRLLMRSFNAEQERWDVTFVLGGAAAIAMLQAHAFDVVVTDLEMPHVDGREVLAVAKTTSPSVACVLHTSADVDSMDGCHVLRKPSGVAVLRRLVTSLVDALRTPPVADGH